MKIVIDMPEEIYSRLQDDVIGIDDGGIIIDSIKDGIPPPKGHGRLIDADALKDNAWCVGCKLGFDDVVRVGDIDSAVTIIEADE